MKNILSKSKKRIKFPILCLLFLLLIPTNPKPIKGAYVTDMVDIADGYIQDWDWGEGEGTDVMAAWLKFNISSIAAETILSAQLKYYTQSAESGYDGDVRVSRVTNQTWSEDDSSVNIDNMPRDMANDFYGIEEPEEWANIEVTTIVRSEVALEHVNCSFMLEDPDYPLNLTEELSTFWGSSAYLRYGKAKEGETKTNLIFNGRTYVTPSYRPILTITYTESAYFSIYYDFPTATDQTNVLSPYEFQNGSTTQKLYVVPIVPYQNQTNVTISGIPTNYVFAYINPNCSSYTDTISEDGIITFYNLWDSPYEVIFDPSENWHTLHISLYAPDGVGLMWESFQIYINETRVPYPPAYDLETGYYEYTVQDYFSQIVFSGSFTVYTSDPLHVYQNWEIPVYEVSFHNGDTAPYNVEITRNAQTRIWATPPNGDSAGIRLYGLAANVEYDIVIRDTNTGEIRDSYPLLVANAPVGRALDYVPDDPSPGGASQSVVVDFLPWTAAILIGVFVLGDFNHRRSQKGQDRKTYRQQQLLKHGVRNEKELSAYERRKMQEAEDNRFGKRRFRRSKK